MMITVRKIKISVLAYNSSFICHKILSAGLHILETLERVLLPHAVEKIIDQHARRADKYYETDHQNYLSS